MTDRIAELEAKLSSTQAAVAATVPDDPNAAPNFRVSVQDAPDSSGSIGTPATVMPPGFTRLFFRYSSRR